MEGSLIKKYLKISILFWHLSLGLANLGEANTTAEEVLFHFRGFCPDTLLEHKKYTLTKSTDDLNKVTFIGEQSARIEYDPSLSQWALSDPRLNLTAWTTASHKSHALGKHNWTISGDKNKCSKNKDYEIPLKLTACEDDEFTCDDGQCIAVEKRCDQTPQCRDESDEQNCKLLVLQRGYNKVVPPMVVKEKRETELLPVRVSLTLLKVIAVTEEDQSISFKFTISLTWRENRVMFHNLKKDQTYNLLREEEFRMLWLPRIIYWNTDQVETTRLGEPWEWATEVWVQREGNGTKDSVTDIDEAEVFQGSENSLRMEQTYSHTFQNDIDLFRYPFDKQVPFHVEKNNFTILYHRLDELKWCLGAQMQTK